MALSHVLELTSGPAVVQKLGYTSPLNTTVSAMRGSIPVAVQVASGGVAAALPAGAVMYYGLKLPTDIKGDWLVICQLTLSTVQGTTGLFLGTLPLNIEPIRAAMHADVSDSTPELTALPCLAEIYYTLPTQADPVPSLNFNFSIGAPLVNTPASIDGGELAGTTSQGVDGGSL